MPQACPSARPCHRKGTTTLEGQRRACLSRAKWHARATEEGKRSLERYKRTRPATSVAARKRSTTRSSTAPQPPLPPALPFEFASSDQQER
ncbi:hypothetical protein JCGZ_01666 [Jatropha curcas]|uniref:Uncharacterized protein n=1 Tax=Jatropha curcas TaxID=180498 RepID=A0A067JJP9_JATCU|nr:hypothetical protein JCGZ_01666 [Jatropha curcas]